jgi:flagellar basal-body rod protein FlgF
MIYGLWESAAGLQINEHRHAVLANNLANVNTAGFKRDLAVFMQRPVESAQTGSRDRDPLLDGLAGGTFAAPTFTDYSPGPLVTTGRDLDIALVGSGFLAVRDSQGQTRYTRNGQLSIDQLGRLRTSAGQLVLDEADAPITVDPDHPGKVSIDETGQVCQGRDVVGRLRLVDFDDPQQLRKVGGNLIDASSAQPKTAPVRVAAGAYEQSGADPVSTMMDMILVDRAYEMNANLLQMQARTLQRAVTDMMRIV